MTARSLPRFGIVAAQLRPGVLAAFGLVGAGLSWLDCAVPGLVPVDPLSALFLIPVFLCAAADRTPRAGLVVLALVAALLAPNLALLVLAFETAAMLAGRSPAGSVPLLALVALDRLNAATAFHDHAIEGWRAAGMFVLLFAGVLPRMVRLGPSALALPFAALYVLARIMFDRAGPVVPGWWGPATIGVGAGLAVWGAWRANLAGTPDGAIGHLVVASLGAAIGSAGLLLIARGSDLPGLAALAGGALALTILSAAASGAIGLLSCNEIGRRAGSVMFDRLGGLARPMPLTSGALAVSVASLAAVPPMAGFAGWWMTLQALLGLARTGGPVQWLVIASATAAIGLSATLALMAAVRLVATVCLGRPRTPRTAAAEDATGAVRAGLVTATGLLLTFGIAPGVVLASIAPVAQALSGADRFPLPSPWFAPLLLALGTVAGAILYRRPRVAAERWEGGREPPPPWLPFGDPAEQWSAASFAAALQLDRFPAAVRRGFAWQRSDLRPPAAVALGIALFLVLLAASAGLGPA